MGAMQSRQRALATGVAALVTVLAACGGGGSGMPAPSPSGLCPLILPAPPDLLYPMNGATGVPDGNFTLVAGYSATPPPVSLVPSGGASAIAGGAWGPAPSPLPSPAATPRSSSETLWGSAIPALASGTTYTVQVTFSEPAGCPSTESAGSFTTQ